MPYEVKKSSACPASRPFAVLKEGSSTPIGCHPSKAKAKKQQAALYANENSAEAARMLDETLEDEK